MSRRLEIELTSQRPDGSWTWRAAGARRPKGEVSGDLVPDAASIGTVLKAEADGGLDGLEIIAVSTPRVRAAPSDRLELIGGGGAPPVTTTLVRRSRRHDRGRESDRGRVRPDAGNDAGRGGRDVRDEGAGGEGRDGRDRKKRKPRRTEGSKAEPRSHRSGADSGKDRRAQRSDRRDRRPADRRSRDGKRSESPRPRGPGLKAKRVHRQAALASLPENQQPLAREVLRAGVPGVRKSIERMNAKASAESLPPIDSEAVLALAERLAPTLKAAEWHDRADAALAGISKIDLRDIRSVIAAADPAARTEETRALAESLRAGLAQRLEVDQRQWLDELAGTIGEGRTIRALRLSSRPPKAGTPLPPDMAERLASMAAEDLSPTTNQQRWSTVVDSVALSPVRTHVIPVGVPEKPSDDLLATIRRLADRVPQIATLFGVEPQATTLRARRPPPPPPPPAPAADEHSEEPPGPAEQPTGTAGQRTGAGAAADSAGQRTGAGAAADSAGQRTGAGAAADSAETS